MTEPSDEDRHYSHVIEAMPPLTREAFLLKVVDRFTIAQIARRLRISRWRTRRLLIDAIRRIDQAARDGP